MSKSEPKTLPAGTISFSKADDEKTRLAGAAAVVKASGPERTRAVLPAGVVQAPPSTGGVTTVEVFKDSDGVHVVYPEDPMLAPTCASLVIVAGPGRGMAVPISYGRNSIGSGADARLRLDLGDDQMSGIHCIVSYDHEDRIFDVREADGATNFTRVNGARINGTHVLAAGDVIRMGATELRFIEICSKSWDWGDAPAPK